MMEQQVSSSVDRDAVPHSRVECKDCKRMGDVGGLVSRELA